jgi:hypothetical protein
MNNITKILIFIVMLAGISSVAQAQSTPRRNTVKKAKKGIAKTRKTRLQNTAKSQKKGKKRFVSMQTRNTQKMMKKARKRAKRRRQGKPVK